jgi:hypothetical protein
MKSYLFRSQNSPGFAKLPFVKLGRVELPSAHQLYWPELDVDLAVASIRNPKAFPLVSKAGT